MRSSMTTKALSILFCLSFAFGAEVLSIRTAQAYCNDHSKTDTSGEEAFFVFCENSFRNPKYSISTYFGDIGVVKLFELSYRNSGVSCVETMKTASCIDLPRGSLLDKNWSDDRVPFRIIDKSNLDSEKPASDALFRFPRRDSSIQTVGCFVRLGNEDGVLLAVNPDAMENSIKCLVALERYLGTSKFLLE
tara:strand:- start:28 stop:600 length:573 start_codon:yes stop_codon:yes gene_type:complete